MLRQLWTKKSRIISLRSNSTGSASVRHPVTALYAGSFDPPSLGHLDVIERAVKTTRCDKLIVSVAVNPLKKCELRWWIGGGCLLRHVCLCVTEPKRAHRRLLDRGES